jgi:O-antigen/teichoic acid export membrane protein
VTGKAKHYGIFKEIKYLLSQVYLFKSIRQLWFHPKVKQASWLYAGMTGSLILGIVNSIVTARFLSPTGFGDYRYVLNVFQLFSSILYLGFYVSGSRLLAINNEQEIEKSIKGALVFISICLSIVLSFGSILFSIFQHANNSAYLSSLFIILSPLLFGYQLKTMFETSFQGENRIKELSFIQVLPQSFFLLSIISVFLISGHVSVQLSLVLQLTGLCLTGLFFLTRYGAEFSFQAIHKGIKLVWDENKRYGIHVYIGSVFSVSGQYLAPIVISFISKDNIDVGLYTLALTITMPLTFIPSAIGTVFFRQFSSIPRIPTKIISLTIIISLISLVTLIFCLEPIMKLLYTDQYSSAANLAKWLSIGAIIHGFADIYNRFLGSHGMGTYLRNGAIATGLAILIGNITLVLWMGANGAVITKIVSSTTYFAFMLVYYFKYQKLKFIAT